MALEIAATALLTVVFLSKHAGVEPLDRWAADERTSGPPAGLIELAGDLQWAAETVRVDARHVLLGSANRGGHTSGAVNLVTL